MLQKTSVNKHHFIFKMAMTIFLVVIAIFVFKKQFYQKNNISEKDFQSFKVTDNFLETEFYDSNNTIEIDASEKTLQKSFKITNTSNDKKNITIYWDKIKTDSQNPNFTFKLFQLDNQTKQELINASGPKTDNKSPIVENILIEASETLNYELVLHIDTKIPFSFIGSILVEENTRAIPTSWQDDGIFKNYYNDAYKKLETLSLDEKIGQLLLARHPENNDISDALEYNLGGYIFFKEDFDSKTKEEVKKMIFDMQNEVKIPLITAVDEEGGIVVRISKNNKLAPSPFEAPSTIYDREGLTGIKNDTVLKSSLLSELGLNVNLAPVVDIATDKKDYMYSRSLKKDAETTADFAETVITTSKNTKVSYTLKHFPGYGNNSDTHKSLSVDTRSLETILNNDLIPFKRGIQVGAEAILVSHNLVTSIDSLNPASLSAEIHDLLRKDLSFTGIIMTDDISMEAVNNLDDISVKAISAGNDLIITSDYKESFNNIKRAVERGDIDIDVINRAAFRVLAWKYYKKLL